MNEKTVSLIALIIGIITYFKSPEIGFLVIIFSLIGFLSSLFSKNSSAKKSKSKDYKIEKEIIIESTKPLPYKIPSKMEISYKPNSKQGKPKWTKVTSKGLLPYFAKKIGKWLKG